VKRILTWTALPLMFVAGFCCARSLPVVHAAAPPLTAQIINIPAMAETDLGDVRPGTDVRSKTYAVVDGATVAIQSGNVTKHFHADANEIQYIVSGSGKFTLGDTVHDIKPGDLIIIPKGTAHAGSQAVTGRFRAIAFKTPPQAADDVHPVP
jgi:mannose-6-phosphate isomerase-like protein (cupin superfamily)